MERSCRVGKPIYEKENQQKFVNKKTDLLASLHNIKLPLHHLHSLKDNQFQSVPITSSLSQSVIQYVSPRRDFKPTKKPIKSVTHTEEYCKIYFTEFDGLDKKRSTKFDFLARHKIDGVLRARMLDWMVEVMSSYNFSNKTYFAGIQIMDRYFESCPEALMPTQLHIIGVQSMFIATKMEQVYPLKMKTVYEKIAHKKIPISQLAQMQNKIAQSLDFCLVTNTIYDIAMNRIVRQLTESQCYSQAQVKQLENYCGCITKIIYYNYDLMIGFDKELLGQTLANMALETYKQDRQNRITGIQQQCKIAINQSISSFKRKNKGLNNLFKFTDKKVLDKIDILL